MSDDNRADLSEREASLLGEVERELAHSDPFLARCLRDGALPPRHLRLLRRPAMPSRRTLSIMATVAAVVGTALVVAGLALSLLLAVIGSGILALGGWAGLAVASQWAAERRDRGPAPRPDPGPSLDIIP